MRILSEEESAIAKPIIISDARCCDCGGGCTLFLVPDRVWRGLGLPKEAFICKTCFAHRLNPSITAEDISSEIVKQRRRFNLKWQRNSYGGVKHPFMVLLDFYPGEKSMEKRTMAQVMPRGEQE